MGILKSAISSFGKTKRENVFLRRELSRSYARHDIKDEFFKELMSDGLRHGSSLAAKHMADRRWHLSGK